MSEVRLRPGLYTIEHVLNRELNIFSYASARRGPVSLVVGSVERNPEFIQEWRVSVVDGGDNTYVIHAPGELPPVGWTPEPAEGFGTGSPIVNTVPPKEFRIQYVEKESRGPEEQAFSIMIPVKTYGASFYVRQSPTLPTHPPVDVVAIPVIPDAPPAPFWIFRPVLLD